MDAIAKIIDPDPDVWLPPKDLAPVGQKRSDTRRYFARRKAQEILAMLAASPLPPSGVTEESRELAAWIARARYLKVHDGEGRFTTPHQLSDAQRDLIVSALLSSKAVTDWREAAANVAETETEPEGDCPSEMHLVPIGDVVRATVLATKKSIAKRIRALPSPVTDVKGEMLAALKPFAQLADDAEFKFKSLPEPMRPQIGPQDSDYVTTTLGQCRRARDAIAKADSRERSAR